MSFIRPGALCVALTAAFPAVATAASDADLKQLRQQLKELREKGLIGFYETRPREVNLYLRQMQPKQEVKLPLDLIATVPERQTGNLRAGLHTFALPFATAPITVAMLWHPRMDADPAQRNIIGLIQAFPELAKKAVLMRKFGQEVIRVTAGKKIHGTAARPRLAVYRSNKHLVLQVIDDDLGVTLVSASSKEATQRSVGLGSTVEAATRLGQLVAERAKAAGIDQVVFDRGGFAYHGRIAAVATAAREAGLEF